jgi:hypothetical protein
VHSSVLTEQFFNVVFGRGKWQVAYVNLLQGLISKCRLADLTKRSGSPASSS